MNTENKAWEIRMEGLEAGYGERKILSGLDAAIPAGKISVILGESGCGKTTLLRVMLGLMPPSAGKIFLGRHDIFSLKPRQFHSLRRRVGVLFQDGALLGSLNLEQNVALPLHEHTQLSPDIIQKTVMDTLALVGLEDAAKRYPGELSGGMRKRAGLARAIITEPPLLFCDEPTSGLDPLTATKMDQLLRDMHRLYPHMTTVVITHDMTSVRHIADHVLMMKNGKAHFNGSRDALLESTDAYIQQFISQKPAEEQQMHTPTVNAEVREALNQWLGDA